MFLLSVLKISVSKMSSCIAMARNCSRKLNNGLYSYLMINRLLKHDRSVLEYSDQKDRTLHSRFPVFALCVEQSDDRKQNIGLSQNRAADNVKNDIFLENDSCFFFANKISVIGNTGSIQF
jgi:hypothetical protein